MAEIPAMKTAQFFVLKLFNQTLLKGWDETIRVDVTLLCSHMCSCLSVQSKVCLPLLTPPWVKRIFSQENQSGSSAPTRGQNSENQCRVHIFCIPENPTPLRLPEPQRWFGRRQLGCHGWKGSFPLLISCPGFGSTFLGRDLGLKTASLGPRITNVWHWRGLNSQMFARLISIPMHIKNSKNESLRCL